MNDDSKNNADQLPDLSEVPELQLDEVSGGSLFNRPTAGQFPPTYPSKPIGWWFPDTVVLR